MIGCQELARDYRVLHEGVLDVLSTDVSGSLEAPRRDGTESHPGLPEAALGECRPADQVGEGSVSSNQSSLEEAARATTLNEFNTSALEAGSRVQLADEGGATAARATEVTHRSEDRFVLDWSEEGLVVELCDSCGRSWCDFR